VQFAFFNLRIALLRGQKKRYEREYALKRRKVHGRYRKAQPFHLLNRAAQ
jgi:hypothetical protein